MGEIVCPNEAPVAFPDPAVWYINESNCHYFAFHRLFIYVVPKRVVKILRSCDRHRNRFLCNKTN